MKNHTSAILQSTASLLIGTAAFSANAAAIVGSWSLPKSDQSASDVALTFLSNGTYLMGEDGDSADPSGQDGMEFGTYSWDEASGAFSFQTLEDTSGQWGLSHSSLHKLIANGNTLTADDGAFAFDRITAPGNPLVGGWYANNNKLPGGEVAMSFLANGTYFWVSNGNAVADPTGQKGMEHGTYTWDPLTGAFTHLALSDTDGAWGFSGANVTKISVQAGALSFEHGAAFATVSEVPEPQAWLLMGAGWLLTSRRRRNTR
jgi:hypothetical protein